MVQRQHKSAIVKPKPVSTLFCACFLFILPVKALRSDPMCMSFGAESRMRIEKSKSRSYACPCEWNHTPPTQGAWHHAQRGTTCKCWQARISDEEACTKQPQTSTPIKNKPRALLWPCSRVHGSAGLRA